MYETQFRMVARVKLEPDSSGPLSNTAALQERDKGKVPSISGSEFSSLERYANAGNL